MPNYRSDRKFAPRLGVALLGLLIAGCGYTTRGLYPDHVSTIAVPIFANESLRRDIEFLLTQNVIQAIEARTPYKVVSSDSADTELRGTITQFYKAPFGEDGNDNPRGGIEVIQIRITWVDRDTGVVLAEGSINHDFTLQTNDSSFVIDLAQSRATADFNATKQLSEQIVDLLQTPW